jgi:Domain of unknown function (DUF3598)
MKSQWNCHLQNVGEWHGSFTQLTPSGEEIADQPSVLTLEGSSEPPQACLTLKRTGSQDLVLNYATLNRSILFFESGAFSQGSLQFARTAEFGAEFGLIDGLDGSIGDRRLRVVQMFGYDSHLRQITLIREQRAGTQAAERPPLQVEDLLGTWQGKAVTLYPDWRNPDHYATTLTVERQGQTLTQQLTFGPEGAGQAIASTATIQGSCLQFQQGVQPIQVLLLPDGASINCPTQIQPGHPFFLEIGWLLRPGLRQRLIRSYDAKGEWISLTLVTEHK